MQKAYGHCRGEGITGSDCVNHLNLLAWRFMNSVFINQHTPAGSTRQRNQPELILINHFSQACRPFITQMQVLCNERPFVFV